MNEKKIEKYLTFFCIEDDKAMMNDLVVIIKKLGFLGDIVTSCNGEDALVKVLKNESFLPDVIISDMMMPKKNGCELVTELRKIERFQEIPIIMLTSISTREVILECILAGADDYIKKPVEISILAQKIIEVCGCKKMKSKAV